MSIHVSLTLTYDVQILICYQNGRLKFVKITNVYSEGTFFHFSPFARTIEWMTTYPDYAIQLYYWKRYMK